MMNEHRKIGRDLSLFEMSETASGMVFWKPKGHYIYHKIESYLREVLSKYDHHEVKSPILADVNMWKKSGHLDKYRSHMYLLDIDDDVKYAVKPMSCPFHIEMFNSELRSYHDLPIRYVEFGHCHRNESSGALNGLLRLRSFVQDDGHVFCRESQIGDELTLYMNMLYEVYEHFGFSKDSISVKISLRPDERVGSDELWDKSEQYLQDALDKMGVEYELLEGEGAFYGAKVEIALKDSLGREWQCGTFQLDFFLGERLGASYINSDGKEETPIILHRALLGSLERFIAILLEHYDGKLPLWLNPNAIKIIPVNDSAEQIQYAKDVKQQIQKELGVEVVIDLSNNSLSYKMRQHFKNKGLYSIIIGDKEVDNNIISVREKKSSDTLSVEQFIRSLK